VIRVIRANPRLMLPLKNLRGLQKNGSVCSTKHSAALPLGLGQPEVSHGSTRIFTDLGDRLICHPIRANPRLMLPLKKLLGVQRMTVSICVSSVATTLLGLNGWKMVSCCSP